MKSWRLRWLWRWRELSPGTSGVFHRIKRNWRTAFAFQLPREFTIQSRLRASCSVWDGRSASPRAKWIGKMASEIIAMKLPRQLSSTLGVARLSRQRIDTRDQIAPTRTITTVETVEPGR